MRAYFLENQLLLDRNMFVQSSRKDFSSLICNTKQGQICLGQMMYCLTNKTARRCLPTFDFTLISFFVLFFVMEENDLQAKERLKNR